LPTRKPSTRKNPVERPYACHNRLCRPPIRRRGVRETLLDQLTKSGNGYGWHWAKTATSIDNGERRHCLLSAEQLKQTLYRTKPEIKNNQRLSLGYSYQLF